MTKNVRFFMHIFKKESVSKIKLSTKNYGFNTLWMIKKKKTNIIYIM